MSDNTKKSVIVIDDKHVVAVWECEGCGNLEEIQPTFYAIAGIPMCGDCDCELTYVRTVVDAEAARIALGESNPSNS